MSGRWIRPGLRYHQQGPGHNIRWDRSVLAAWPLLKKGKSGQTRTEKEIGQNRKKTHLNQRKKSGLLLLFAFALAFAFAFCFTPFFHDFKGIKTKEKSKTKKNQSPDLAIVGGVRTRDPDPDHFGPDFDSGSGYGSAFTDP